MTSYQLIAALGSSFAAGPGIEPIAEAAAMRSHRNYPSQLAARLGARLVDLSVSGATTANVLDTPQQIAVGVTYPPQVEGIPADADVVTITAGGNDLQFAGALLLTAWQHLEPTAPIVPMLTQMLPNGIPVATDDAVEQATAGLVQVVEAARQKAPHARIVLVDYLTVLGSSSKAATPFSDAEVATFLQIQDAIGRVFADAAARSDAELVLASVLSADHGIGSAEPWVQPFHQDMMTTAGSFHPNELGMTAIAAELERMLTTGPNTTPAGRLLALEGTHNFRDIGGYATADGGSTRWRKLYRSDALHRLTDESRDQFADLGITLVIDLRDASELLRSPSRIEDLPLEVVHQPIFLGNHNRPTKDVTLANLYRLMLAQFGDNLVGAVGAIARSGEGAVLVHCTAGKDRTGLVVALSLLAAGVNREAVVADYAATEANLAGEWTERMFLLIKNGGIELTPDLAALVSTSPASVMEATLDHLEAEYGSATEYLLARGLTTHDIEAVGRILVESPAHRAGPVR